MSSVLWFLYIASATVTFFIEFFASMDRSEQFDISYRKSNPFALAAMAFGGAIIWPAYWVVRIKGMFK